MLSTEAKESKTMIIVQIAEDKRMKSALRFGDQRMKNESDVTCDL